MQHSLSVLIKPVSGQCNMKCRYCFYVDEMAHRDTAVFKAMDDKILEMVVRRSLLAVDHDITFCFQGGEPTLAGASFFRKFLKLERQYGAASGLTITHTLQTNGLSLSEELLDVFEEGNFLIGVSVDGTKAIHDSRRIDAGGQGTYDRVLKNLKKLDERGIPHNILCVVDNDIARRPQEVFKTLAPHFYLQFIACLDPLVPDSDNTALAPDLYGEFLIEIYRLYAHAIRSGKPVSIRTFDDWLGMLMGHPPGSCGLLGHCTPYILIESNGNVYPCDFYALDEWCLGNIVDTTVPRILRSERMMRFLRESHDIPEACPQCEYYMICRGGCRRDRDRSGALGANRLCAAYKRFFKACLQDMKKLCGEIIT